MNPYRSVILVLFGFFCIPVGMGQTMLLTKDELKDPVLFILQEYQNKIALIRPNVRPDPVREFSALFTNPYVKVVNNLSNDPAGKEVIVRNYAENIKNLYPSGVSVEYNPTSVRLGKIVQEHGNQYAVTARFRLTLNAFPGGVVYENRQYVEFRISFTWDRERVSSFRIAHIGVTEYQKQDMGLFFTGGGARMTAPWMKEEERVSQKVKLSGSVSGSYTYWLSPDFGIGSGLGLNYAANEIVLNQFDPIGERDPNLSDVHINLNYYAVEIPVHVAWKGRISEQSTWLVETGVKAAFRYWGNLSSKGWQSNLNQSLDHIMSYSEWEADVASMSFSAFLTVGMTHAITKKIFVFTGIQFIQGLKPLDQNQDPGFSHLKYTGQYNPLWMDPDTRNFNQFAGLHIGLTYQLEREK